MGKMYYKRAMMSDRAVERKANMLRACYARSAATPPPPPPPPPPADLPKKYLKIILLEARIVSFD